MVRAAMATEPSPTPNLAARFAAFRLDPETAVYVLVSLLATAPAWIVKHPPLQDLPFHLATIRVLHDFHTPGFGFDQVFRMTLGRTQYLVYYFLASGLAYLFGIKTANVLLLSTYLAGTPLTLRSLLKALGKDGRAGLLIIPTLINILWNFGLLPFLFGIPLFFLTLTAAVRHFDAPSRSRGIFLGISALALFYAHIFPFGLFAIAFALLFPYRRMERWGAFLAPMIPTAIGAIYWAFFTLAGRTALGAAQTDTKDPVLPLHESLSQAWTWLGAVFRDNSDERLWILLGALVLLAHGLSLGDRTQEPKKNRLLVVLPLLCFGAYFVLPQSRGPIYWLYAQRFPFLAILVLIPVLRFPQGLRGQLVFALAALLATLSTGNTCKHYIEFEKKEVGEIDEAIASIPKNQKVAALIFDKSSNVVEWVPFLHFGSYYQLEKGGVIQFSYVGYDHWPFEYLPGKNPPPEKRAPLRWEWTPEQRDIRNELAPYYDYILVRGAGFRPPSGPICNNNGECHTISLVKNFDHWSVYKRD